ncbi:2-methoxy-6-polyprenyl-1,4-benzoquinol methylase protein [Dioscorea alata]|nr:2-methoxy-6-polyprenyl-1,4-benzoquinol methylase protein [Dioscorea alata]
MLHPFAGMKHLDVAGGTGDAAFRVLESINSVSNKALQEGLADTKQETKIFVCDINPNMLNVGKMRAIERGFGEDRSLHWVEGDAEALSFADGSMDGYTIAFGIRNVTHIEKALSEAYRVLKRGGRFLCLELSHVELPVFKQIYDYYSFSIIPAMGELVAGDRASYQYLVESIHRFPNQTDDAGWSHKRKDLLWNIAEHSGSASKKSEINNDTDFMFQRSEFGQEPLVGTVQMYGRHVFLCHKCPDLWPSHIETTECSQLPGLLSVALKARKEDLKRRTCLTIYQGEDDIDSMDGDVMIFPDMIKYKGLTQGDVDNFVDAVLVKESGWSFGEVETLSGSYVFVCAHGSRDRRCGLCGPVLVRKFREEIKSRDLHGQVSVHPCSHVGGHKFAGNVIIFSKKDDKVIGDWYGYVSPDDVPTILEQHIGKGRIVDRLWRGSMGLSKEEQKKAHLLRLQGSNVVGDKV